MTLKKKSFLKLVFKTVLLGLLSWKPDMTNIFMKQWISSWLSNCSQPPPLVFIEMTSLNHWLSELMGMSSSLYLWPDALYTISYVASKGISHRGFSRFKRTEYLENQHSECMDTGHGVTHEAFKRIQEFALYPTQ